MSRNEARIGQVRARGPLPHVPDEVGPGNTWMDAVGVEQLAAQVRTLRGRRLPLELARQPRTGPARERVRLVVRDVHDRLARDDRPPAGEGERRPGAVLLLPVPRTVQGGLLEMCPTVRQPQVRPVVTAVGHELEPLAIGDGALGYLEVLE